MSLEIYFKFVLSLSLKILDYIHRKARLLADSTEETLFIRILYFIRLANFIRNFIKPIRLQNIHLSILI